MRYLFGPAVDQILARTSSSGTTAWYLTDQLGSVRFIENTSGTVLDAITYDAFGNITGQSDSAYGDRFMFAGMQFDATVGIYYDHARYYDAAIGRFVSQDPKGFAAGDTNLYRYVENVPTSAIDPSGNDEWGAVGGVFGGVSAGAGVGGLIGGPPGAIIGGLAGAILGGYLGSGQTGFGNGANVGTVVGIVTGFIGGIVGPNLPTGGSGGLPVDPWPPWLLKWMDDNLPIILPPPPVLPNPAPGPQPPNPAPAPGNNGGVCPVCGEKDCTYYVLGKFFGAF